MKRITAFVLQKVGEVMGVWVAYVACCLVGEKLAYIIACLGGNTPTGADIMYALQPLVGMFGMLVVIVLVAINWALAEKVK